MDPYGLLLAFLLGYFVHWLSQPKYAPTVRLWISPSSPAVIAPLNGTKVDYRPDLGVMVGATPTPKDPAPVAPASDDA